MTQRYLSALAVQMRAHHQVVFYVESLRATWLVGQKTFAAMVALGGVLEIIFGLIAIRVGSLDPNWAGTLAIVIGVVFIAASAITFVLVVSMMRAGWDWASSLNGLGAFGFGFALRDERSVSPRNIGVGRIAAIVLMLLGSLALFYLGSTDVEAAGSLMIPMAMVLLFATILTDGGIFLQHFLLRLILWQQGKVPWNYSALPRWLRPDGPAAQGRRRLYLRASLPAGLLCGPLSNPFERCSRRPFAFYQPRFWADQ